jgi:hypothetical protein
MVLGFVIGGLALLGVLLFIVPAVVAAAVRGPLNARIAKRYREEEILSRDLMANSFGLQSKGVFQVRGNGALVLTRGGLHFFMLLREEELRIPLDAILEAGLVRAHLGKTVGRKLLKVRFLRDGAEDAVAWYVRDPAAWESKLRELRRRA